MQHIHLPSCSSTQDYLIENIASFPNDHFLVTTDLQTNGRGQRERKWDYYPNSLCFSFNCAPHSKITLSALEVAVLICDFLQSEYRAHLKLKWPNDILNSENQKCGGILINSLASGQLIIGIGLNLFPDSDDRLGEQDYDFPAGHIFQSSINKEELAKKFVNYFHDSRIHSASHVKSRWIEKCAHLNQKVLIGNKQGVFTSIGNDGQALVKINDDVQLFYSERLRFLK